MQKPFTKLTVVFLFVIAIAHLARLVLQVELSIGGVTMPQWISVGGLAIPATLALMLNHESRI